MTRRKVLALIFLLFSSIYYAIQTYYRPASSTLAHTVVHIQPEATRAPLVEAVRGASSSIDVVMYQFEDMDMAQELAAAAERGVSVRVLLNRGYYGKKENTHNDAVYEYLSEHSVPVRWTPEYFALTHQKTFIVDATRAYILTYNLTPQYYATSRDIGVVDASPSDVRDITHTFDLDWGGVVEGAHPRNALIWSPGAEESLVALIDSATSTLDIYAQEMTEKPIQTAIIRAAARGVRIRIIMTENSRWHKAWRDQQKAGISVHIYPGNADIYIHAKMFLVDGMRMYLGSQNISQNSLMKNRELGVIVSDPASIARVKEVFEKDYRDTQEFSE